MSMNLNLSVNITATNKKTGKEFTTSRSCDLWQTPTNISYAIMEQEDKLAAYVKWVLDQSKDQIEESEILGQHFMVIGKETRVVNYGKDHVEDVKRFIEENKADGELEWFVM